MKGIRLCFECADYDKKKHRCLRGAKTEDNPQDPFYDDCPLPDVAPVVHAYWDDSGRYRFERDGSLAIPCSNCGCALKEDEYKKYIWNYCPSCGARMDLKEGDNDGTMD